MPRQLNLFSAEELAKCYLHGLNSRVVNKVRQSLKADKEKQEKQKLDNVIKFPIKFVS